MGRYEDRWMDPMVEEACNCNKHKRKSFEQERKENKKEDDLLMENNFDSKISNLQNEFKSGPTFIKFSNGENESEILKNDDITSSSVQDSFDNEADTFAVSKLFEICASKKWNPPLYEEIGHTNHEMFSYKVMIKVETIRSTIIECFSDPKCRKMAAKNHAAQGVLWFLKELGHCS